MADIGLRLGSDFLPSKLREKRKGRKKEVEEGMERGSKVGDIFPSGAEGQSFSSVPVAYPRM